MFRIRDAFKALQKRWVISLLLIIQFTLGLSVVTGTANIFYNLYYLNTKSLLDFNSTYLVAPDDYNILAVQNFDREQVEAVYQRLDEHPDVITYGTYNEDTIFFEDPTLLDNRLAEALTWSIGLPFPQIRTISVDENYYNLLDMNIKNGQGFSELDFQRDSHETFPVLAGSFFKDYYDIGDFINDQYYINGFLSDGYIVNNNTSDIYLKTDKALIKPMPFDTYNDFYAMFNRLEFGTVLQFQPDADLEQINDILYLQTHHEEAFDIQLTARHFGEEVRGGLEKDLIIEIPQLLFIAVFILFVLISIVVTTLVSILIRRREFGIKLALGESLGGIFTQIVMEISMIALAGLAFSTAYFSWNYSEILRTSNEFNSASVLDIKLDFNILFLVFLVLMLIVIIASLILYPYIKKQEPKSMIGGTD